MVQTKVKRPAAGSKPVSAMPETVTVAQSADEAVASVQSASAVEKIEDTPPSAPKVNLGQRVWPD
jgi:hypothetical protein